MPFLQFKTSVAKTASYSLLKTDHDKWFTNTGAAGAVVFTLPAIADVNDGWLTDFFVTADQNLTITAPAGKLVAFNNAAATSLAFSTVAERIGGGVTVRYDSGLTKYVAQVHLGIETQTPVVT